MTPLEGRYRRVLQLLPESYRQTWEDDMVAAFLESMTEDQWDADHDDDRWGVEQRGGGDQEDGGRTDADKRDDDVDDGDDDWGVEDYRWPGLVEVASVALLAIRLRTGAGPDATPAAIAWGRAIRLACLVGVLSQAVMITNGLLLSAWLSGGFPDRTDLVNSWPFGAPGVWHTGWLLLSCGWVAGYGALLAGRRRSAQLLALLALVPQFAHLPIVVAGGDPPATTVAAAYLSVDLLLIATMTALPDGEAVVGRRRWLLALPVGVLAVPLPIDALGLASWGFPMIDWPGVYCAVLAVAVVWHRVARRRQPASQRPEAGLALVLLAGTALALRALTLYGYHGQADQVSLLLIAAAQFVGLLVAVLPLANTIRGQLRPAA